jgi:Calcineurin-like phosphoesterase
MAKAGAAVKLAGSTSFSAARYAHPFFVEAAPAERQPFQGHTRLADLSKLNLGPIPQIKRGGLMKLSDVIGAEGVKQIEQLGEIRFHALGDSGQGHAHEAEKVSDEMATDFKPGADALNPAFLFHLGDVIYGNDKAHHYGERFYTPYRHYPGKIIAIPGNHDGEVRAPADDPSLSAFLDNFCATKAAVAPQAAATGIFRETMMQPGAYWMLDAPFLRIIGLYSNLIENPGYLEGKAKDGKLDSSQLTWLQKTLSSIAKKKDKKALIIATHHPPYSAAGHSGSKEMNASIDKACASAGITPHAILSAHAHNYQRYTRRISGKQVPYIVAGTGGMNPQHLPEATGQPADSTNQVTYDAAMASLGYLFVTASKTELKFEFWQHGSEHTKPFDPFTVHLASHTIS